MYIVILDNKTKYINCVYRWCLVTNFDKRTREYQENVQQLNRYLSNAERTISTGEGIDSVPAIMVAMVTTA